VAAAAVALLSLPPLGREPAEARLSRYFELPAHPDTVAIRAAILRRIPLGSSRGAFRRFVSNERIGADGRSIFGADQGDADVIRVDEKPGLLQMVTASYIISFDFAETGTLDSVRVRHVFTGP